VGVPARNTLVIPTEGRNLHFAGIGKNQVAETRNLKLET
jgi:hypothetical protein